MLSPPPNDDTVVIDATAAPGNKTSHLSALMKGKGKVRDAGLAPHTTLIKNLYFRYTHLSVIANGLKPLR